MKYILRLTLASLCFFFLTLSISAQSTKQIEKATTITDGIATALALDEATKGKIYDLNLATYMTLKDIKDEDLPKSEMKARNKAAWKTNRDDITTVLGKEKAKEYKKYLKLQKKEKKKMKKAKKVKKKAMKMEKKN